MSSEAKVGMFFLFGMALILGFTLFVSKIGVGGDGFQVLFPKVDGLDAGSAVTYNGIPVGRVQGVQPKLIDDVPMVEVTFSVEESYLPAMRVGPTTTFSVSQGMLGGASMVIEHRGQGVAFDQDGLTGHVGQPPMTFTQALEQIGDLINENRQPLNKAMTDLPLAVGNVASMAAEIRDTVKENRGNLKGAVAGAKTMTEAITAMVNENRTGVAGAIKRIDGMADEITKLVAENRTNVKATVDHLPETVKNISGAAAEMQATVKENRAYLAATLKALASFAPKLDKIGTDLSVITGQVRSGHGTLGRLVFEDTLHEKTTSAVDNFNQRLEEVKPFTSGISDLKFYIGGDFATDIDTGAGAANAYLRIEPKPWKFYQGGLTYRFAPSDRDTAPEDPEDLNIDLNLALGWRFFRDDEMQAYRLAVRGGLLEGALGGQADYRLWSDRLSVSALVRAKHDDFALTDRRYEDGDLMARAWLEYRVWRGVSLIAGGNDLIDDPAGWVGIRGELLDNDIRNFTAAGGIIP